MRFLRPFTQFSSGLSSALLALGAIFLVLMAVHITVDVASRLLLGVTFSGTTEVVAFYYMTAAVFLPLAYVEKRGEHIDVELLFNHLSSRLQFCLYLFACATSFAYFGALFYQTLLDALDATGSRQTAMANFTFYIWPSRWILPLSFFAILLAILVNVATALRTRSAPHRHTEQAL